MSMLFSILETKTFTEIIDYLDYYKRLYILFYAEINALM